MIFPSVSFLHGIWMYESNTGVGSVYNMRGQRVQFCGFDIQDWVGGVIMVQGRGTELALYFVRAWSDFFNVH